MTALDAGERNRIADTLHESMYGPLQPGVMHGETVDCGCYQTADVLMERGLTVVAAAREPLDAAWREAEAALPEGWIVWGLGPDAFSAGVRDFGIERTIGSWEAQALGPNDQSRGSGPTPAAALHALAEALRKPVPA